MIPEGIAGVSVLTKTYVTLGLVILALFEFFTAMYIYGIQGKKRFTRTVLVLHRIGGYVFLFYWIWPILVGADLLTRLSRYEDGWSFDGPRFFHAFLGVLVLLLVILKILFVRFYQQFRTSARWLGLVTTILALATWIIAGWFWLQMMGGARLE